ncbi:MAG: transglutaminase domain-containing protein [Acetobacteraceae bacterium]|nr:transglutaminase domain-containing protein [Acetobacteraceae bacterium]
MTALTTLIQPTEFLDFTSEPVRAFMAQALRGEAMAPETAAVRLFYAVRDRIRYEIYGADLSSTGFRASTTIGRNSGLCIHKSIVYAAAVRALGIPSRLVFGNVRNHLASPQLCKYVGGDVFHYHCLVAIHLNDKWLKVTPVFNKTLCHLFGMKPLEFDGRSDSIYHPFDERGQKHMEFVHMHGEFDDMPYDQVIDGLRRAHPNLFKDSVSFRNGVLAREAPRREQAIPG